MRHRTLRNAKLSLERVLALFSHDPAQAGLIVGFGAAGLAVIGLWGLYGDLFLSNLVVVGVSEILTAGYVVALALLAGRLVRSQDRWQVESALTFRQMLGEAKSFSGDAQAGSPFYARRLRMRLQEEISRCREYGTSLSLLTMRLELPGQPPSHAVFTQANNDVAELVAQHEGMLVSPTALGMFEYAFCLPNCDRRAAKAVTAFLEKALKRYRCFFGLVVFPEDAEDGDALLRRAIEQCGMLNTTAA